MSVLKGLHIIKAWFQFRPLVSSQIMVFSQIQIEKKNGMFVGQNMIRSSIKVRADRLCSGQAYNTLNKLCYKIILTTICASTTYSMLAI